MRVKNMAELERYKKNMRMAEEASGDEGLRSELISILERMEKRLKKMEKRLDKVEGRNNTIWSKVREKVL